MPALLKTKDATAAPPQYSWQFLLRIFIPFALGYFLSYLYRVVNSIIAGDLSTDLNLNATELGFLTSAYLITFAVIQLPLGVLLDRYGPRRIEAFLLLFAALGAAIFATATSFSMLVIGRALIGLGVSACLMAAFKSFVQWFPADRLPLANGLHMTAGGLGVLCASSPTAWLLETLVWRELFWILAIATLLVAFIIFFAVPDKPSPIAQVGLASHIGGILHIFRDRYFWRIIPVAVSTQAAALALIGLWTGPWFRDIAGFNEAEVASSLLLIAVSMITGYILIGYIAYYFSKRGISSTTIALVGMSAFILTQIALAFHPVYFARPVWMLFGFFSTSSILTYAALSQRFSAQYAGRANTALNFLVFAVGFFTQWGIGVVIDTFPSGAMGSYASEGYQQVFIYLVVVQVICLAWYACSRR
ncbi:MAG: sugar phosphate permease [Polaribacter sp.]|jgi:sugar phosphate permease